MKLLNRHHITSANTNAHTFMLTTTISFFLIDIDFFFPRMVLYCVFFNVHLFCLDPFRYPRSNLKFRTVKKTLQRIKNTAIPRNPTSVHEINEAFKNPEILQHFGYTLGDDDTKDIFFDTAIDTGTFSYAVFSSKKQINSLNEYVPDKKMHILMDATFRTCPKGPFNQLLILYARIHHKVSKTIRRMIILSPILHSFSFFL